jgi:predicted RNA polymerase sigma factor
LDQATRHGSTNIGGGDDLAPAPELDGYRPYHTTRAELLRPLPEPAAEDTAPRLTSNPAELALLERRLS